MYKLFLLFLAVPFIALSSTQSPFRTGGLESYHDEEFYQPENFEEVYEEVIANPATGRCCAPEGRPYPIEKTALINQLEAEQNWDIPERKEIYGAALEPHECDPFDIDDQCQTVA